MSSLIKQHGKYYLQFYDKHRSPQRRRVALQITRKREAQKHQRRLEEAYRGQEYDPWTDDPFTFQKKDAIPETIKEAMEAFLSAKKKAGRSENTIRSYRGIIRRLMDRVGSDRLLQGVSGADLSSYIRDESVAKTTRHKRYRHLKAFLRWCLKEQILPRNPMDSVEPPDKPEKLPKVMSEADLNRICDALMGEYEALRARDHCREGELIWYAPLFRFAFYTGMRASELGRLRWGHIDVDERLIYIYEQKNKKEQTIPLNAKAEAVLDSLERGAPEDFVFTSPAQTTQERKIRSFRDNASRTFTRAKRLAGIDRPITFHSGPSTDPLPLQSAPLKPDWMTLDWTEPTSLDSLSTSELPSAPGIYKIASPTGTRGLYIGETTDLRSRIRAHARRDWGETSPFVSTYALSEDCPAYQRRELETDLLGGYYHLTGEPPACQYGNLP